MRCPNCGARIKLKYGICPTCHTKVSDIKEASFSLVRKMRKEYQPERVVYTTIFPKDLSFKSTLLFCIFLGWAGGHAYYVQRYFKASMHTLLSLMFLFFMVPCAWLLKYGTAGFLTPMAAFLLQTNLIILPSVCGAIAVIIWFSDIVKLLTRHFEVPVVMPEKKK